MRNTVLIAAAAAFFLTGCEAHVNVNESTNPKVHIVKQSTLWIQVAGEYRASAVQAWRGAATALDKALADPQWTAALEQQPGYDALPPAIIVDADETVIDNSRFEAQLVINDTTFEPSMWDAWVQQGTAGAVPGALEFLNDAASRGVKIFYVTNRDHNGEAATLRNLKALGFPVATDEDVLLMRGENGWTSDKSPRRALVAERYRVVIMAGDDMNDFVSGTRVGTQERLNIVDRYEDYWGERWIVLPNPMYGSWDRALYDYDRGLSEAEKNRRRVEALRLP